MKLSLTEAYKQATPGPLVVVPHVLPGDSGFVLVANDTPYSSRAARSCNVLDADLLVHCRNNFAEAVALLKRASKFAYACGVDNDLSPEIDAALERFETVEVL